MYDTILFELLARDDHLEASLYGGEFGCDGVVQDGSAGNNCMGREVRCDRGLITAQYSMLVASCCNIVVQIQRADQ